VIAVAVPSRPVLWRAPLAFGLFVMAGLFAVVFYDLGQLIESLSQIGESLS
jgi:hypothetical protein